MFGSGGIYANGGGRTAGVFDSIEYDGGGDICKHSLEWDWTDTGDAGGNSRDVDLLRDTDRTDERNADCDGDKPRAIGSYRP